MRPRVLALIGAGVLTISAPVVMQFEGAAPEAYLDAVSVPTICYGHTATAEPGMTATDAQCRQLLHDDMRDALAGIEACVAGELEPHEWAALTSWAYNVGVGAACRSTLVRQLNAGRPSSDWCNELSRWVYAGGKRLRGLERRREAERALCLGQ